MKITRAIEKQIMHFLDFLCTIKFLLVLSILLLIIGIILFEASTAETVPQMKECKVEVNSRTTSKLDTLRATYISCNLKSDSLFMEGKYVPNIHSSFAFNVWYEVHGIYEGKLRNEYQSEFNAASRLGRRFKWYKRIDMSFQGMEMGGNKYHPYPDSLTLQSEKIVDNTKQFLLGRTVNHTEMSMMATGKDLLSPDHENNPYMTCYFNFDFKKDIIAITHPSSNISINFSRRNDDGTSRSHMRVIDVYPAPDYVLPYGIRYNTKETIEEALKNGIYLTVEDLDKKKSMEERVFLCTLFLGIVATSFLGVIVAIVRRWKEYNHNNNL